MLNSSNYIWRDIQPFNFTTFQLSNNSLLRLYIYRWQIERYAEWGLPVDCLVLGVGSGVDDDGLPFHRVFAHQHLHLGRVFDGLKAFYVDKLQVLGHNFYLLPGAFADHFFDAVLVFPVAYKFFNDSCVLHIQRNFLVINKTVVIPPLPLNPIQRR